MHTYSHGSGEDSDNESFHSAHDYPIPPPLPVRRLNRDKDEEDLRDETTTVEKFPPDEEAVRIGATRI